METKKIYPILGVIATLLFIIAAVYITAKNHKKEGFWYGVLALALVGSYIYIGPGENQTSDGSKLSIGSKGLRSESNVSES